MSLPIPPSVQKSVDATKVNYVRLGSSGLQVSWPILGAMSLGDPNLAKWVLDEDASLAVLKAAYDRGINTWDTANSYSNGQSEVMIGRAIRKFDIPRHKLIIMTKICMFVGQEPDVLAVRFDDPLPVSKEYSFKTKMPVSKDYVNQGGLSRAAIFNAVEASLARLGVSYIDVLQIHRFDPATPPEETMKALHDLVQAGKVRYLGASSMWATQFARLQFIAERHGWTKFISMQNYYNLCYREEEREMNRFCNETGVGLIPWSPLYAGRLARPVGYDKSARSARPSPHHPSMSGNDEAIIARVEEVANKKGWSMLEVALAWHKSKGSIPIVGLNSAERVDEACRVRDKVLEDDEVLYLEEIYEPRRIAGHA